MAGQPAERRRPRRREREHGPGESGLGGERPQVLGRLVHVALAGHHDQEGRLGQEEGHEAASGAHEAGEGDAAGGGERAARFGERGESGERGEPAGGGSAHGPRRIRPRIAEVDRPGTSATRATRPPAASTSARPTISSAAQSAPFTSTSGRRARTTSIGVGSS